MTAVTGWLRVARCPATMLGRGRGVRSRHGRAMGTREEAEEHLRRCGEADDGEIDVAAVALSLSLSARPDIDPDPYRVHLWALVDRVAAETKKRHPARYREIGLMDQVEAVNSVLFGAFGYAGDRTTYDDLQNADLISVIDRRRGLPVALGILYLHAARGQGWSIDGLSFPGHFLLRLHHAGAAAVIDPFNAGRICEAADLRDLMTAVAGDGSTLKPEHCEAVGNRAVLLRLENNIKLRLLHADRTAEAAAVVERMLLFAPNEAGLWREAGVLHARLGNLRAAVAALERLEQLSRGKAHHADALRLVQDMKARLN